MQVVTISNSDKPDEVSWFAVGIQEILLLTRLMSSRHSNANQGQPTTNESNMSLRTDIAASPLSTRRSLESSPTAATL